MGVEKDSSVSAIVSSLVAAFARGCDVLRRGKGRKEGAGELGRALKRGRREVRGEYEAGVRGVGREFGGVDARASLGLAHTLLKLNAGLVDIVAGLLDGKKKKEVDWMSLTSLSETCSREAVGTLSDLRRRLSKADLIRAKEQEQQLVKYQEPKKKHVTKPEKRAASSDAGKPYWELQLVHKKPKSSRRSSSSRSSKGSRCECCSRRSHDASTSTSTLVRTSSDIHASRHHSRSSSVKTSASSTSLPDPLSGRKRHAQRYGMPSIEETQASGQARHRKLQEVERHNDYLPAVLGRRNRDDPVSQEWEKSSRRLTRPSPPDRPFNRAATARYSMASTKIGEIPADEWEAVPFPNDDMVDPLPWGWGGPVSSVVGGKASKFGFLDMFKERVPQRVI
ncbi:hypothetical protein BDZ85DRAFT_261101 [Elsinoe ampelina]|uniref:Uncharacterized protein n=1 Tax=Elsinoe ampelina TaxID=302913 RepID=A0A6A6GFX5_9PEZI|nr:hypothetical protein BDZ85DRAFT_261101 [Elsinoe ampelina]